MRMWFDFEQKLKKQQCRFFLSTESSLKFLGKKMSDNASVTASSLAITENKPQRTGGCVGIFFQLFDWNRRFAKKKLFSKRLLPPGSYSIQFMQISDFSFEFFFSYSYTLLIPPHYIEIDKPVFIFVVSISQIVQKKLQKSSEVMRSCRN